MQPPPQPPSTQGAPDPRGEDFDIGALPATSGDKKRLPAQWNRAWIAVAGALALYCVWFLAFGMGTRSQRPMPLPIATASAVTNSPALVTVHVAGAVARPGVYSVAPNARIADAINQAGGPTTEAETTGLNMAAFVQDGAQILVPVRSTLTATDPNTSPNNQSPLSPDTGTLTSPNGLPAPTGTLSPNAVAKAAQIEYLRAHPIDLNAASSFELQQLPGIGPMMADDIIAYRTANGRFRSVSDLDNVKGIGEKRMEVLKDLVVVR